MRVLLAGLAVCLAWGSAAAHTALSASQPASGAEVQAPVAEIALEFNGPVRLTAVIVADAEGVRHAVEPAPEQASARFVLAVPEPLKPGQYVLNWRAVGADTHIVSGEVAFTVTAP